MSTGNRVMTNMEHHARRLAAKVDENQRDPEKAHGYEDELCGYVLRCITGNPGTSGPQARLLAEIALSVKSGRRWYA